MFKQLSNGGAFLTTKVDDKINTMTIGWASIGTIWGKPIMTVYVRYSRNTYGLLEKAKEFTVSVPIIKELKEELMVCGTKSGRDIDKFTKCNLTAQKSKEIDTPIIGECQLHFECKVVFQQAMEPALVDSEIKDRFYKNNDYHIMYYGEIKACYINE